LNARANSHAQAESQSSLRGRKWQRFLRGPDASLLEELYVPALATGIRYNRCCSYFSSTVLAAAARGFGRLIERLEAMGERAPRPAVRLVVNEELAREDVRALTETGDTRRLEEVLSRRFKLPKEALEKERLAMLAWLVKKGLLEVRVGVMRHGEGIVHAKFGIITDERGDAVVFSGSGNESAQGVAANYERLEVSTSWEDPERYDEYAREFECLWCDRHPDVHTLTLPEALRLKLVKLAPPGPPVAEPSGARARQKAAMIWHFLTEAPYLDGGEAACDATAMVEPWPHQQRVIEEAAAAWPEGRLLCDEVGMGKTIEAILILRRLMAGRGVRRVLLLVPAGLLKQWQAELREKGGLIIPRLEGTDTLIWPDDKVERVGGLAKALEQDALLLSRETARTENNFPLLLEAQPWDLVILDEAHAARRREQQEGEFNKGTLLLDMLRRLQLERKASGFLFLSATPMQTHPWEPWDLLSVLGEGGKWLADFSGVRDYYEAVAAVEAGMCDLEQARRAARMIAADPQFPDFSSAGVAREDREEIVRMLTFARSNEHAGLASWLRLGSPLGRRMHRNTRSTLKKYYEMGLLAQEPPVRKVEDIHFDYQDDAERRVYESVKAYIEKRFAELEHEKPGKGFVMTIYRRRASSSPQALRRSLERRRDGLKRVIERKAIDPELAGEDHVDRRDLDDLGEGEAAQGISAALPASPQVAKSELADVDSLLADLQSLGSRDSKRDRFFDELRRITEDGRPVLVFTEYADTMEYLRDTLVPHYEKQLGCYSGEGGQVWDGTSWQRVTKDVITERLRVGELRVLVCTDGASEGLNLQAAGAVINYDLPWNPSKVEQRIGRIDRIGQRYRDVRVINFFLKDSVDDRVYALLRKRCGLFEHFVGAMQPVLAQARKMLLGREPENLAAIQAAADQAELDLLARETYLESDARNIRKPPACVQRGDLVKALELLNGEFGPGCSSREDGRYVISGAAFRKTTYAATVEALEKDASARPLSPLEPRLRELAQSLLRPGEHLPLVIGSHQQGGFRRSVAYWVGGGEPVRVESAKQLEDLVERWDGRYPDPAARLRVEQSAAQEARRQVEEMERMSRERMRAGLERQLEAARLRLIQELGRYVKCFDPGTDDLNDSLYRQSSRDITGAPRLRRALERLGGYPEWDAEMIRELGDYVRSLSEGQRRARLLGKELDAALEDPRWSADLRKE